MADALQIADTALRELAGAHDLLFCDLYGTLHDEAGVFLDAVEALRRFRGAGGTVVLVSNAALRGGEVAARIGLPADAFDAAVTSLDVALAWLERRGATMVAHLGTAAERASVAREIAVVDIDEADAVLCTGFPDGDIEAPLARALERRLDLVGTNPDRELHVGGRLLRFAGLVAERYRALDGRVIETGKPARAIYDAALAAAGRAVPPERVLCVGDSFHLDVAGAISCGYGALWIDRGGPGRPADRSVQRASALTW